MKRNSTEIKIGDRVGNMTVEKYGQQDSHRNRTFFCRCDCGTLTKVRSTEIFNKKRQSCGCRRDRKGIRNVSTALLNLM